MRNVFILVALLLITGIAQGQNENKFYQSLPKGYYVEKELGLSVEADFDKDGVNDLAIILFEEKNGLPIFCMYLSSTFNTSRSFKYCDWEFMRHDMNYENGILSLFSDNGSMGQYGTIKLKYDRLKKSMVIVKYDDVAGNKTIKFKDWKF